MTDERVWTVACDSKPDEGLRQFLEKRHVVDTILLVGFYLDRSPDRVQEFLACIKRNADNRKIAAVHVFVEEEIDRGQLVSRFPQLASPKAHLIVIGRRLTYRDLFDYANRELPGRRVIIANADIFFDHTLARLEPYDLTDCLLCLSRWDLHPDGSWRLFDFESSQDAWIFQSPVPDFDCDFHLGLLGCDNRLAWEAARAGLVVVNPCRSVRAYHLHSSGIRRYTHEQRLYGPTLGVQPVHLDAAGIPPCRPILRVKSRDVPCAAAAFHESMGYTIDLLQLGASSHNNEVRPFTAIPEQLVGRSFTQVVSCVESPVNVQFLSSGRVYVLVGTDWDGYYTATAWLGATGEAELMPFVETCHRPAFEVWSLLGERGDQFVAPTQVMLVSDYLERR